MYQLKVSVSNGGVGENVFVDFPVIVGRDRLAGIQVREIECSRVQAKIYHEGQVLIVEDLGSRNGTIVFEGTSRHVLRKEKIYALDGAVELHIGDSIVRLSLERGGACGIPIETVVAAGIASSDLRRARIAAGKGLNGKACQSSLVYQAIFRSVRNVHASLKAETHAVAPERSDLKMGRTALLALTYELWSALGYMADAFEFALPPAGTTLPETLSPCASEEDERTTEPRPQSHVSASRRQLTETAHG